MHTTRFEHPENHGPLTATVATMNLVTYVGDDEHRNVIIDRAKDIATQHPLRLIVLDVTKEGALCAPSSFSIASSDPQQLGHFVNGALLQNLPTVLWWASKESISPRFFTTVYQHIDEILVDSSRHARQQEAIVHVNAFHALFSGISIRDLAWIRGRPWRNAIAHLFDHTGALQHLQSIRAIEITGGSFAEAQYIVGWLASRLGWVHEENMQFRTRDNRKLKFLHTPAHQGKRTREIRLASASANFRIVLDEFGHSLACFSQSDTMPMSLQYQPYQSARDAELIETALLTRGTDELFDASMRSLREE